MHPPPRPARPATRAPRGAAQGAHKSLTRRPSPPGALLLIALLCACLAPVSAAPPAAEPSKLHKVPRRLLGAQGLGLGPLGLGLGLALGGGSRWSQGWGYYDSPYGCAGQGAPCRCAPAPGRCTARPP
jgi:hypothetical protein